MGIDRLAHRQQLFQGAAHVAIVEQGPGWSCSWRLRTRPSRSSTGAFSQMVKALFSHRGAGGFVHIGAAAGRQHMRRLAQQAGDDLPLQPSRNSGSPYLAKISATVRPAAASIS